MSTEPSISIITVCRNAIKDLQRAVASVLAHLGPDDEWIVQDGASRDGSAELLRHMNNTRIRWVSEPDHGIYDAMNKAVSRANGAFVLFLGVDDRLWLSLDEVRERLHNPDTVYYGDVRREQSGDRYAGPFDGRKLARTNICQQAIFYPRTVFDRHRFDIRYPYQADWALNMACFSDPSIKFEYLPLVVAIYGQSGISSTAIDTPFQREYRRLLRRHFTFAQRWQPELLSLLSVLYRRLPGIPPPRQRPAGL